jgi:FAD/FMN-containing dehydrogenase
MLASDVLASFDMEKLLAELADIPQTTDPALVRQKSRDFFWYSPVLNRQLQDYRAEAVISPRNEVDVVRVAAACFRHGVPITARGGGTGNYGQAVPLRGGVVLDMTALDGVEWQRPGMLRVGAGRKMIDIDRETRGRWMGIADASVDETIGDGRRFRRRRLGRNRVGHLGRPARNRQRRRRSDCNC